MWLAQAGSGQREVKNVTLSDSDSLTVGGGSCVESGISPDLRRLREIPGCKAFRHAGRRGGRPGSVPVMARTGLLATEARGIRGRRGCSGFAFRAASLHVQWGQTRLIPQCEPEPKGSIGDQSSLTLLNSPWRRRTVRGYAASRTLAWMTISSNGAVSRPRASFSSRPSSSSSRTSVCTFL